MSFMNRCTGLYDQQAVSLWSNFQRDQMQRTRCYRQGFKMSLVRQIFLSLMRATCSTIFISKCKLKISNMPTQNASYTYKIIKMYSSPTNTNQMLISYFPYITETTKKQRRTKSKHSVQCLCRTRNSITSPECQQKWWPLLSMCQRTSQQLSPLPDMTVCDMLLLMVLTAHKQYVTWQCVTCSCSWF